MAETRYKVKSEATGDVFHLPLHRIEDYATATNVRTGRPLYRVLDPLPGVVTDEHGRSRQTQIPPDRVLEAYSPNSALRVLRRKGDPVWENARRSAVETAKQEVAEGRSSAITFSEGLLSGATFGQSSRLANYLAGEGAAEARARSVDAHGISHFAGQAASLLLLGALPIPGLGAAARGASTGARAGSIFEVGARASDIARKAIPGEGFLSEVGRRLAGPITFGAVVDAPLSAALVAADIVDRDKPFTAEAFSADFMTQYLLSIGIAATTSVPFAFVGATVRSIGKKAVGKADALVGDQLTASIGQGVTRHIFRPHRSKSAVVDVAETHTRKMLSKALGKRPGQLASEHWLGRFAAGKDADGFMQFRMTYGQLRDGMASAQTAAQLRKFAKIGMNNLSDPDQLRMLSAVADDAAGVAVAKRKAGELIADGRRFAEQITKTPLKHPPKAVSGLSGAQANDALLRLNRGLEQAGLDPLPIKGGGNLNARFDHVLNQRWKEGVGPVERKALHDALEGAFPNASGFVKNLRSVDEATEHLLGMTARYGDDAGGLIDPLKLIAPKGSGGINVRNQVRRIDGNLRKWKNQKVVDDFSPFTRGERPLYIKKGKELYSAIDSALDEFEPQISKLSNYNKLVSSLQKDATPFFPATKPATHAEILGAQVRTVMTVKQRVWDTLKYIQFRGGALRHTATFGGVFAFRDMKSAHEKRAVFKAYHDAISATASTLEDAVESVSPYIDAIAKMDMGLGMSLAGTQVGALAYLNTHLPRSDDPQITPEQFSSAEIENFLEIVGALTDPLSVLATAADGSVTEQGVDAISTVYPELYAEIVLDVAEFADRYGEDLTHENWIGLDTFTNFALGYVDTPMPMQEPYAQTTQQSAAIGGPENRRMTYQQGTTPAQKISAF